MIAVPNGANPFSDCFIKTDQVSILKVTVFIFLADMAGARYPAGTYR